MKYYTEEQQTERDEFLKVLLYGQSGSGKTTLACTFPDVILVDFEKGKGINRPKLHVVPDNFNELDSFIEQLKGDKQFINNYETVIFDSLNEIIEWLIADIVLGYKANRQYDDQLTQSDYGKVNREVMKLVRKMVKDLSDHYNLVFTCAEQQISYQDEQRQPSIVGKVLPTNIPRLMDIVGCTFVQKETHVLAIANSGMAYAKNRYGISGKNGFIRPDYATIEQLIQGTN